ncbi:hypothetical protein AZE42_13337 [Rhizopogon vesiculosus]|uniref:Uncharacterized protein n=1 Tax=Rhizopogon vesiculosus TaxID=180088 RepID=A0A1J8Q8I8_9AGAM|nr:hypothetical protein AZE42_13337 [Rhizopogon vesiculosus]
MSHLLHGSTALVTATSRPSRTIVDDQNLSFEDFCQDMVKMMAFFWRNLQTHPLRPSHDPLAQRSRMSAPAAKGMHKEY